MVFSSQRSASITHPSWMTWWMSFFRLGIYQDDHEKLLVRVVMQNSHLWVIVAKIQDDFHCCTLVFLKRVNINIQWKPFPFLEVKGWTVSFLLLKTDCFTWLPSIGAFQGHGTSGIRTTPPPQKKRDSNLLHPRWVFKLRILHHFDCITTCPKL